MSTYVDDLDRARDIAAALEQDCDETLKLVREAHERLSARPPELHAAKAALEGAIEVLTGEESE